MKTYKILIVVLLFFIGCSEIINEETSSYKISGNLVQNGNPLPNAIVIVDDKLNWKTESGLDGSFEINDVSEGNHTLKVSYVNNNGSFVEMNQDVAVNQDIFFDALILPTGTILNAPYNVTSSSMSLSWNKTDALDFREYKLYRHTTSGLDETTGTLVHVATSVLDTLFTDTELQPFKKYYFRVYVMNEYGRLGGSNIVSDTTYQINLIWNGDFELEEDLLNWWSHFVGIEYQFDETIKKNGNFSLFLHADTTIIPSTNTVTGAGLYKYFNSSEIELEVGRTYKVSGWIKTEGETHNGYGFGGYIPLGGPENQAAVYFSQGDDYAIFVLPGNTDWTYFEKTFIKSESSVSGIILICSICEYSWFDDLKITLVE